MSEVILIGAKVKVTQCVELAPASFKIVVTGTLYARDRFPTISAFAGGERGRYWVERVYIEKADGERCGILLDQNTVLERVE